MTRISVIIPIYQNEDYLQRCLESLLAQTFLSFDLFLIDDGSIDKSGQICDSSILTDTRIHVLHKKNVGPSDARNVGLDYLFQNNQSEWIFFIDSDDWIDPSCLETLYNAVKESNLQISSCTLKRVNNYYLSKNVDISFSIESSEDVYTDFGKHALAYPVGRLYKKELFESLRFPIGRFFEDVYLLHKVLLQVDKIAYIKESLYYYFVNESGTTRKQWTTQRMDGCWAYEEQLEYLRSQPEFSKTYKVIQRDYLQEISYSYYKLQQSDYAYKEYYLDILSDKMRAALKKYGKSAGISLREHTNYYEIAGLKRVNFYWKYQALKRKFIKR